jgi:hypothetical protein
MAFIYPNFLKPTDMEKEKEKEQEQEQEQEQEDNQYKIHDSLFKDALSYPSEVEKLIRAYTPAAIVELIDWTTLDGGV